MATSLINTNLNPNLLLPGVHGFHGMDYRRFPAEWSKIYDENQSYKNYEIEIEMQMLGNASTYAEGGRPNIGTMKQSYVTTAVHQNVGIGFQITRNMVRDNLYPSIFPRGWTSCKNSHEIFEEITATILFNNAFNAVFPIADGQPLCSTAHPYSGGTFSNTIPYSLDLNETALNDVNQARAAFKDPGGLPFYARSKFLYVSPKLAYQASILSGSEFRTGTNQNDISPTHQMGILPQGFVQSHYFVNPNNWFNLTDVEGFKRFTRQGLEVNQFTDPFTANFIFFLTMRYSYVCTDARAVLGVQGF